MVTIEKIPIITAITDSHEVRGAGFAGSVFPAETTEPVGMNFRSDRASLESVRNQLIKSADQTLAESRPQQGGAGPRAGMRPRAARTALSDTGA